MFEQLLLAVGQLEQAVQMQGYRLIQIETCIERLENTVNRTDAQPLPTPSPLATQEARQLKERLTQAGLIDHLWNPTSLSGPECALLAKAIADRLNIDDVWQQFGQLWNINPPTLRSYFNRAMNQKKSLHFQDRIKGALKQ